MVEKVKIENPKRTIIVLETIKIILKTKRGVLKAIEIVSIKSKKITIENSQIEPREIIKRKRRKRKDIVLEN